MINWLLALPKISNPEPKRPKTPYSIFISEEYGKEKEKNPTLTVPDIGKILAERWKNLSDDVKKVSNCCCCCFYDENGVVKMIILIIA